MGYSNACLYINPETGQVVAKSKSYGGYGTGDADYDSNRFKDTEDTIYLWGENERWYDMDHLYFLGYDEEGNPLFEQRIPPYVEPEPTDQELANSAILLGQTEIITRQNEQDEVLAAILLNGLGV